ncbi:MAG: hypothetical protein AMXMBFR25_30160 [Lysobacterales bacterium]
MSFATAIKPLTLALALAPAIPAHAASFVYEGRLDDRGAPATGDYEISLTPFADATLGAPLAAPVVFARVPVREGRFRLEFDLPTLQADAAWLQLAVRDAGSSALPASVPGRTKAVAAGPIGACWSSTGDSGTDPATHFLGTTDAQPLVLRTRNVRSLRLEPSTELFNGNPLTLNFLAGSYGNTITTGVRGATVSGGGTPQGNADPAVLWSGYNGVFDHYGTVGGGAGNIAGSFAGTLIDAAGATVSGGIGNHAEHQNATIGGGEQNRASGFNTTVAGGFKNYATGINAAIGGGQNNLSSGDDSVVPGGVQNVASGDSAHAFGTRSCAGGYYSWAGGRRAKVRPGGFSGDPGFACNGVVTSGDFGDEGSFVWADSSDADFISNGPNQFRVRAGGGAVFNSDVVPQASWDFVVGARSGGDDDADLVLLSRNNTHRSTLFVPHSSGGLVISADVPQFGLGVALGAGRYLNTGANGAHLTTGGTWTNGSSRAFKEAVEAIDPGQVLQRVLDLGISRWRYIGSDEGAHIGPMAEDFHAAFATGSDAQHIATVDADGVALAAIQGLNAKLEDDKRALGERLERLDADNRALRADLRELRALLASQRPAADGAPH